MVYITKFFINNKITTKIFNSIRFMLTKSIGSSIKNMFNTLSSIMISTCFNKAIKYFVPISIYILSIILFIISVYFQISITSIVSTNNIICLSFSIVIISISWKLLLLFSIRVNNSTKHRIRHKIIVIKTNLIIVFPFQISRNISRETHKSKSFFTNFCHIKLFSSSN